MAPLAFVALYKMVSFVAVYAKVCSWLNKVLCDRRLGAKLRVAENRCVLHNYINSRNIYSYI